MSPLEPCRVRRMTSADLGPVLALELADLGGEGTDDVAGLVGRRNGCGRNSPGYFYHGCKTDCRT